ncbi:hypothetical protein M0R45_026823 [Rubus argutus]|uniref:Uncharacterized protein n=1 Tax=Rubus argutus TaxID=59490 RepID=A0AAW1WYJ1_RUBAR
MPIANRLSWICGPDGLCSQRCSRRRRRLAVGFGSPEMCPLSVVGSSCSPHWGVLATNAGLRHRRHPSSSLHPHLLCAPSQTTLSHRRCQPCNHHRFQASSITTAVLSPIPVHHFTDHLQFKQSIITKFRSSRSCSFRAQRITGVVPPAQHSSPPPSPVVEPRHHQSHRWPHLHSRR